MKLLLSILMSILVVGLVSAWLIINAIQSGNRVTSNRPPSNQSRVATSQQDYAQARVDTGTNAADSGQAESLGYAIAQVPVPTVREPEVPVYPGMKLTDDYKSDRFSYRHSRSWETTASYQDVFDFYKDALPKAGWTREYWPTPTLQETLQNVPTEEAQDVVNGSLVLQDPNDDPTMGLDYQWYDTTGQAPYGFHLGLGVETAETATRVVNVVVERVPNENRIPVPPDAQQVQVSDVRQVNTATEWVIDYLTDAKPEQVRQYYQEILKPYGWGVYQNSDGTVQFGFGSYITGVGGPRGHAIIDGAVSATIDRSGKTRVEIKITKSNH